MQKTLILTLLSVLFVSLISFVGIFTLSINAKKLKRFLIYIISFSAGALLGDTFIHLLPELIEKSSFTLRTSIYILSGILIFFSLEKIILWRHCHLDITEKNHVHSFAYINLIGDALHNFIDGIIIAATYLISIPAGIATTLAVALHEVPQEIGDFGVLVHGGFSKSKALLLNFTSALFAILGALLSFFLVKSIQNLELILIPIAAGGFIYIAGSDLIPEIHKDSDKISKSLLQLLAILAGIAVMFLLIFLE